jgi:hypothetical protein
MFQGSAYIVKLKLLFKLTLLLVFLFAVSAPTIQAVTPLTEAERRYLHAPFYDDEEATTDSCISGGGTIDRFMQALAFQESGGNPTQPGSAGGAKGKYQYLDSTWRSRYSLYGPASAYSQAHLAPEEIQDAVVYIEYSQQFRKMDGDLFKIAIEHFYPKANTHPEYLDIIPSKNVITPRQYAEKLIEGIESGLGSDIPLLYSQAPEFDEWLERAGGPYESSNVAGTCLGGMLDGIECPATMEAHPTEPGYFRMPEAPNNEYLVYSIASRRWGSQEMVCALHSVALAYYEAMAGKSKLRIGNLNTPFDKPSRSHRWGVANDHSGFGEIQAASHVVPEKGTYSKEATVLLGKLWVDTEILSNIWWCPPPGDTSIQEILDYAQETQGGIEGQIKCVAGHKDHFHVDIKREFRLHIYSP